MTHPTPTPTDPRRARLLLVADHVHPYIYRAAFPAGLPAVDAVLAAGDLPGDYLEFLATKLPVPVVYVHGNHGNEHVHEGDQRLPPRGVICAHSRVVQVAGLRIAGWGGVPQYRTPHEGQASPGQFTPRQAAWGLRLLAWQARRGVDVLLTHAPPEGPHAGADHAHRGAPELNAFMRRTRPALVVHGHIHEYEGKKTEYLDADSGARVVNAYGYRILDL